MVYYRAYRPQLIDDLDNADVREKLTAILAKDVPHAFLFTGPKGLGKTSTARIVAKVVNCQRRLAINKEPGTKNKEQKGNISSSKFTVQSAESIEPCNQCESCVTITNGTNLDVLEIDAASNRGIDEIRELKEKIRLAPLSSLKKVYIIDEVHMLTTEAFNALLKTLEEPPSHAVFILCTTEMHKVPSTILSRSFHIGFHLATEDELVRSFRRIVKGEKLDVSDDVLLEIARLAEGGFRDGAKILEEVVAVSQGEKITIELVEKKYHITGFATHTGALLEACVNKDVKQGLGVVSQLVGQGTDLKYFLSQVLELLHSELLMRSGIEQTVKNKYDLSGLSLPELKQLIRLFMQAQMEMKAAVIASLPLELALVEWMVGEDGNQESGIKNQGMHMTKREGAKLFHLPGGKQHAGSLEENEVSREGNQAQTMVEVKTETVAVSSTNGVSLGSLRKQAGNIAKIRALYGESKESNGIKESEVVKTTDLTLMHVANDKEISKEWLDEFWKCLISEVKQHNHTLAGVLRGCMLRSFDRKSLIIETAFKFHKEKLDDVKTKQILEQVSKSLTGLPIMVTIELKSN